VKGFAESLLMLVQDDAYFAHNSTLGVSSVRLVPKPNGFRPIVNMGKRIVRSHSLKARIEPILTAILYRTKLTHIAN
jgi:hypothetical protein